MAARCHVPLALAGLHGDVALPGEACRVAETAGVLEDESLARHTCAPYAPGPRSIEYGCQRTSPLFSRTDGFTQLRGQRPFSTSAIS